MSQQATEIVQAMSRGNRAEGRDLMELVYTDLRKLANHYLRQEDPGHSLQATDLVHEAFVKLVDQSRVDWKGRSHFFAVGAQAMRRILVNHAKKKKSVKRGGGLKRVDLDEALTVSAGIEEDVLAMDEALEKLATVDATQARIVEFRFFAGMTVEETAEALGLSKRTVEREWTGCRAWLRRELSGANRP